MTIVIPKPGLADRLLRVFGKKRGVTVESRTGDSYESRFYFVPRKESLLKAALRPPGEALPTAMADIFTLQNIR